MKKESRRVKMTKALLNQSFLHALEKKPLPRITVKEICENADVNRSTYYVYYTDPYDQLNKIEENFIEAQTTFIQEILETGAANNESFVEIMCKLLGFYKENKYMLRVLFGKYGNMRLEYDILSYFAKYVMSFGEAKKRRTKKSLQNYTYAASGCFGLIIHWLQTDCEEPEKQLAETIAELTQGIRH
ncbi:MAG: TetR family transcriptional regulator C-terminal domain-containing protein [Lachnospiraceae bacterium]|nr:TetR family transcriptional regulator C-terminal domain-containing protein [Lachnospiraceae bacterium]